MKYINLLWILLLIPIASAITIEDGVVFESTYTYTTNTTNSNSSTISLTNDFYLDTIRWCDSPFKIYYSTADTCMSSFNLNISNWGIEWIKLIWT